jgi:hypothetical protein
MKCKLENGSEKVPDIVRSETTWKEIPIDTFSGSAPADPSQEENEDSGFWEPEKSGNAKIARFLYPMLTRSKNAFSGIVSFDPLQEETYLGFWGPGKSGRLRTSTYTILSRAENAFTEPNTVESEADQIQKTILQFDPFQTVLHKSALTSNLLALFSSAKEEDSNSPGLEIGSLRSFLGFMLLNPTLRLPSISLTPECHVYITWKMAKGKLFSVRFLPDGNIRFVLFSENKLHPNKIDRTYGITTSDLIMQVIEGREVKDWICNEG